MNKTVDVIINDTDAVGNYTLTVNHSFCVVRDKCIFLSYLNVFKALDYYRAPIKIQVVGKKRNVDFYMNRECQLVRAMGAEYWVYVNKDNSVDYTLFLQDDSMTETPLPFPQKSEINSFLAIIQHYIEDREGVEC